MGRGLTATLEEVGMHVAGDVKGFASRVVEDDAVADSAARLAPVVV